MNEPTPEMIEHDARMLFDDLMCELGDRGATVTDSLAALRRIVKDGNGWA